MSNYEIYIFFLIFYFCLFFITSIFEKNLLFINIFTQGVNTYWNTFNNLIQIFIKLQAIELPTLDEIKWKQSETLLSLLHHCTLFIQLQTKSILYIYIYNFYVYSSIEPSKSHIPLCIDKSITPNTKYIHIYKSNE